MNICSQNFVSILDLLMKLQRIKANQAKIKQIVDLVQSRSKAKKLHVTIRKSFYEMTVTNS